MKKRMVCLFLTGMVLSAGLSGAALAQEVVFSGKEKCTLTVLKGLEEDASSLHPSLESLNALGVVNESHLAIAYSRGKTGYVTLEEIAESIPSLNLDDLPSVTEWEDIRSGSSGDHVSTLQQALNDLGYLDGGVDGAFGPGTEGAVKDFQKSQGLAQTGVVDAACWFEILEEADPNAVKLETLTAAYPPVVRLEDKFRAIANDVEDIETLRNFLDSKWVFTYDTFEGVGRIELTRDGLVLGQITEEGRAVDRMTIDVRMYVDVRRSEKNIVTVKPVIEVSSSGSRRPYVKGAILRHGYAVANLTKTLQEGTVEGMTSKEVTLLGLDEEAFDVVAENAGSEMVLRIQGMNKDYDLDLAQYAETIEEFLSGSLNVNLKQRHLVISE